MNRLIGYTLRPATLATITLLTLGAAVTTSCRLGQSNSASFASVIIPDKTPEEICSAAAQVFQEDGYQVASLTPSNMIFQKEASRGQSLANTGVVDTMYGASTLIRVRAELVDLGAGSHRLQCQAFVVRNAGDSFFEDESRRTNLRRMPYQNLLDKVAARLK
jgi:hypothetical protein